MVDQISGNTASSAAASSLSEVSSSRQQTQAREKANTAESSKLKIRDVAQQAANEKKDSLISLDEAANELRDAINTLNTALAKTPTKAIITRDEDLNRFIVRIADKHSGEVVREIPSEAILKFARNLQELKGLIFDTSL